MNYFSMLIISQFCITIDNAPSLCDCLCRQYAFNEKKIQFVQSRPEGLHDIRYLYFSSRVAFRHSYFAIRLCC